MIYRRKNLQAHPMKLFMLISATDTVFYAIYSLKYFKPEVLSQDMFSLVETFCLMMNYGLNYGLILDLLFMIWYPFSDKSAFMMTYQVSSFVWVCFWTLCFHYSSRDTWYIQFMFMSLYLAAAYSIFFGKKALSKPGISGAARNLVRKRHVAGIIMYIVTSLYVVVHSIFTCYDVKYEKPWF